ncbi:helix-turn-helix domain-containing protein [Streptomyces sp. NPDC090106]|uniref:helix-turn-helix domain-containing protein n=1 Tax=Streptomyces sp. NPDC090106 TaxID=3365946 RepID=UPI003823038A
MTAARLPRTAAPDVPAPPPGLVVLGRYDEPPGYGVTRPRGPDSWLFTWTTGGAGLLRHGPDETRSTAGQLVALAPGSPHGYGTAPGAPHWRFWWVHCRVRPTWLPWLRPHDRGTGLYVVPPASGGVRERVDAAFRRMRADARGPGADRAPARADGSDDRIAVAHGSAARELALCALEEVVLLTSAGARGPVSAPDLDPRVGRVQELIAADPGAPHTVASLAAQVALSPSRLAHLYTGQAGVSPMRALREARLRHAARLLEATGLSVERVAAASGFASPFHFHRVFRERFGTTPGAYRAKEHLSTER